MFSLPLWPRVFSKYVIFNDIQTFIFHRIVPEWGHGWCWSLILAKQAVISFYTCNLVMQICWSCWFGSAKIPSKFVVGNAFLIAGIFAHAVRNLFPSWLVKENFKDALILNHDKITFYQWAFFIIGIFQSGVFEHSTHSYCLLSQLVYTVYTLCWPQIQNLQKSVPTQHLITYLNIFVLHAA